MSLKIVESFNSPMPPRDFSEDAVKHNGRAAWVIDGATGHSDYGPLIPGAPSDASWYAHAISEIFYANIQAGQDPGDAAGIFREGICEMRKKFMQASRLPLGQLQPHDLPSAAALYMYHDAASHSLHFHGFADCAAIVLGPGGFCYVTPGPPDLMGEAEKVRLLQQGKHTKEHEQAARAGMNNPGHSNCYWVLGIHPEAADNAWKHTIHPPTAGPSYVMLITDGLDRLRKTFGYDAMLLLKNIKNHGFADIAAELRKKEKLDANLPHIKTHDDVSGLLFELCPD